MVVTGKVIKMGKRVIEYPKTAQTLRFANYLPI